VKPVEELVERVDAVVQSEGLGVFAEELGQLESQLFERRHLPVDRTQLRLRFLYVHTRAQSQRQQYDDDDDDFIGMAANRLD